MTSHLKLEQRRKRIWAWTSWSTNPLRMEIEANRTASMVIEADAVLNPGFLDEACNDLLMADEQFDDDAMSNCQLYTLKTRIFWLNMKGKIYSWKKRRGMTR